MKSPFEVAGIVNESSRYSVMETMDRIESVVWARGMKVYARINQQLEAKQCNLAMHESQVLIFYDARIGTSLITSAPSIALDLPWKIMVWESASGEVWVSYNSLEYLRRRHGLEEIPFPELDGMILKALH